MGFLDFLHLLSITTHCIHHCPVQKYKTFPSKPGPLFRDQGTLCPRPVCSPGKALLAVEATAVSWIVSCPARTEGERRTHLTVARVRPSPPTPTTVRGSEEGSHQAPARYPAHLQTPLLSVLDPKEIPQNFLDMTKSSATRGCSRRLGKTLLGC